MINTIKERFIELSLTENKTELEHRQLEECKRLLKKHYEHRAWELGKAMNYLKMAHITNDWDWVKQIGVEMEQMREGEGR